MSHSIERQIIVRSRGLEFACSSPEKFDLKRHAVDGCCRSCVIALGAAAVMLNRHYSYTLYGTSSDFDDLRDCYEVMREFHSLPPLPERVTSE